MFAFNLWSKVLIKKSLFIPDNLLIDLRYFYAYIYLLL